MERNMPHKSGVRNIYLCRDAMYSSNSLRTHFGPPSSSHASRWACVSGRHEALTLPALLGKSGKHSYGTNCIFTPCFVALTKPA